MSKFNVSSSKPKAKPASIATPSAVAIATPSAAGQKQAAIPKADVKTAEHYNFSEVYKDDLIETKDAEEFILSVIKDIPDEYETQKKDLGFAFENPEYKERAIKAAKMILIYTSISLVTFERASFEDLLSSFPKSVIHPDQIMLNELMVNYIRMENESEIRRVLSSGLPDYLFEDRMDRLLNQIKSWAFEYL